MSVETSQIRLEVPRSLKALVANLAQVDNSNLQGWITGVLLDRCLDEAEDSRDPAMLAWAERAKDEFYALMNGE